MLIGREMASGFRGFVGRDSPKDNPTHVKDLGKSFDPSRRVTLPPCKETLMEISPTLLVHAFF